MLAALLLAAGVFAPAASARQGDAEDTAHTGRELVAVPVSAVDREGRAVEGLKPEDLRVTVEGQPQNLLFFLKRTEEPLHVVVMLDASASQELILPQVQPAAARFVSALLRPGRDDAAVVSFAYEAKVVQGLTADAVAVGRAISSVRFVPPPGYVGGSIVLGKANPKDPAFRAGSTALWDSLAAVCDELFARAQGGRRAVVIVTDGMDTSSDTKRDRAVEHLMRNGVAVYSVGVADEDYYGPVSEGGLREVSKRTGGRAVFPKKPKDLPAAFERIRGDLLASYVLKFARPAVWRGGKPLRVRVELVNPELRKRGVQLAHPQNLSEGQAAPPAGRQ
ncbi:MAG: VWA domain-containing protein [Pyrinomonadaceae bacterium]